MKRMTQTWELSYVSCKCSTFTFQSGRTLAHRDAHLSRDYIRMHRLHGIDYNFWEDKDSMLMRIRLLTYLGTWRGVGMDITNICSWSQQDFQNASNHQFTCKTFQKTRCESWGTSMHSIQCWICLKRQTPQATLRLQLGIALICGYVQSK
jgi:hypothetical protein